MKDFENSSLSSMGSFCASQVPFSELLSFIYFKPVFYLKLPTLIFPRPRGKLFRLKKITAIRLQFSNLSTSAAFKYAPSLILISPRFYFTCQWLIPLIMFWIWTHLPPQKSSIWNLLSCTANFFHLTNPSVSLSVYLNPIAENKHKMVHRKEKSMINWISWNIFCSAKAPAQKEKLKTRTKYL